MGSISDLRDNYILENDVYIKDVTFASETSVSVPNPFAGSDTDKIDVQITEKGSAGSLSGQNFGFEFSGNDINILASASSTATVRVRIASNH